MMQTVLKQVCYPVSFLACAGSRKMYMQWLVKQEKALFKKSYLQKFLVPWNRFEPSSKIFLLAVPRRYFFCGSFVFFVSCVSHAFASVHCCLVVTCWERADLLTLVGDVYCIFVIFPCGILGQVWYLIVSFPDLCLLFSADCYSVELDADCLLHFCHDF